MISSQTSVRIEATPAGANLAAAIEQSIDRADEVRMWWLGQAGFALKHQDRLLLIDPYLSDSLAEKYRNAEFKHLRMTPAPIEPAAIRGCQFYLCTHAHTDHMDPGTIRGLRQESLPVFVVPRAEINRAIERGVPDGHVRGLNAGEALELARDLKVEAMAAAHERLETDANGNHKFLGYVISVAGLRLYHSGDCVPYDGLAQQLANMNIDVALLPINGRDAYRAARGVPGNFTLREAIELCTAAGIPQLIGHHFEMFDFNTIDRSEAISILTEQAGALKWLLPGIGLTYHLRLG